MEGDGKSFCSCLPKDPDQNHPWLLVSQGENLQDHSFYNISKNEYIKNDIPEFGNKGVAATSYGWLLLIDYSKRPLDFCLLNPKSNEKVQLPSTKSKHRSYQCVLSKPPTDLDCYVLLISSSDNSLFHCRLGDEKFIKRTKEFGDDYFSTATNFMGGIYAWMSNSGNFVKLAFVGRDIFFNQIINDRGQICQIPWPSPSYSGWHADYLVESCGDLLLVHRVGYHHSAEAAYFRIFRIKVAEGECEELKSIGDRVIFLSNSGAISSLCTKKSHLKNNSICYTWLGGNFCIYDIEDRSKTLIKSCPIRSDNRVVMSWIML